MQALMKNSLYIETGPLARIQYNTLLRWSYLAIYQDKLEKTILWQLWLMDVAPVAFDYITFEISRKSQRR